MTRINLIREVKGPAPARGTKNLMLVALFPLIALLACAGMSVKIARDLDETLAEIERTKKDIAHYKSLIAEAQKAKEKKQMLQDILKVIESLRKEKSFASRVLSEVSIHKPDKLHLELMKKEGTKLGIEGIALDDETVANFMTNLRRSSLFKNVDLVVTEQIEQSKVKLKKFTLSCEIGVK